MYGGYKAVVRTYRDRPELASGLSLIVVGGGSIDILLNSRYQSI